MVIGSSPHMLYPRGRTCPRVCARRGFTLPELLVVLGIITILMSLALPMIGKAWSIQRSVNCSSNLRQIAIGFRLYAHDWGGKLPNPTAGNQPWEQILADYLNQAEVFHCGADQELFPAVGSSYDWRDTANPLTSVAGRSLTELNRSEAVLVFDAMPGWHQKGMINAAMLDGSSRAMDQEACFADLDKPIVNRP